MTLFLKENVKMNICVHDWIRDHSLYICSLCGNVSNKRPYDYVSEESEKEEEIEEKCKHVWECLRDRCHNRGKGKYQAYKCKLCGKFQRR